MARSSSTTVSVRWRGGAKVRLGLSQLNVGQQHPCSQWAISIELAMAFLLLRQKRYTAVV